MATAIPGNQCEFTLAEAASATGGRLAGDGTVRATSVSIDTRTLQPGALFVALRGAGADGHDYLGQAVSRGAACAIVETGHGDAAVPCIEVADTLDALGALARRHLSRVRSRSAVPVIAIGGAVGKTTTKELTAAAARAVFGETLATFANLNNLIGVPMTIFGLSGPHRAAVLECGTNTRGEIAKLAAIVEPDAAMVLNVDFEHNEGLGTLDDIADEEASLFATAKKFAVASADEPMVLARIPSHLRRITFGKSAGAQVRLAHRAVGANGRTRIGIEIDPSLGPKPVVEFEIGLLGEATAINFTAAIAGVAAMNSGKLDARGLEAIAASLSAVVPVAGRLATRTIRGVVVIDDTYNSSPRSIRAALAATREVAAGLGARVVIAMGDMLELGPMSPAAHLEAVGEVMRERPAAFIAVGPEMRAAIESLGAATATGTTITVAGNSADAGAVVARTVRAGDVLLVKGSRGIAMEQVFDALA